MKTFHIIQQLTLTDTQLLLTVDGHEHVFELSEISEKLAGASTVEKEHYQISPSGYGIHWPLLDEDLSIDGLLGIVHTPAVIREKAAA